MKTLSKVLIFLTALLGFLFMIYGLKGEIAISLTFIFAAVISAVSAGISVLNITRKQAITYLFSGLIFGAVLSTISILLLLPIYSNNPAPSPSDIGSSLFMILTILALLITTSLLFRIILVPAFKSSKNKTNQEQMKKRYNEFNSVKTNLILFLHGEILEKHLVELDIHPEKEVANYLQKIGFGKIFEICPKGKRQIWFYLFPNGETIFSNISDTPEFKLQRTRQIPKTEEEFKERDWLILKQSDFLWKHICLLKGWEMIVAYEKEPKEFGFSTGC